MFMTCSGKISLMISYTHILEHTNKYKKWEYLITIINMYLKFIFDKIKYKQS